MVAGIRFAQCIGFFCRTKSSTESTSCLLFSESVNEGHDTADKAHDPVSLGLTRRADVAAMSEPAPRKRRKRKNKPRPRNRHKRSNGKSFSSKSVNEGHNTEDKAHDQVSDVAFEGRSVAKRADALRRKSARYGDAAYIDGKVVGTYQDDDDGWEFYIALDPFEVYK